MDAGILSREDEPLRNPFGRPEPFVRGGPINATLSAGDGSTRISPVSLIIPTFFNDRLKNNVLRRLLDGLDRSDAVREVILVASDPEGVCPPASRKRIVVAECEPNRRARSRNIGAERASHDLLMFLDDDMLLDDWRLVDVLVSGLLTGGFDAALFPRRHYAKFPLLYNDEALDRLVANWRAQPDGFVDPLLADPVREGSPQKTLAFCFPGCFTLIRREAFDRIGGFPEEFEGWGFEDAAFGLKAIRSLRVWNLFRASPPLLHVDHPVSPYKSDEYYANLRKFHASHSPIDMDRLCRRAVAGDDFSPSQATPRNCPDYLAPLRAVADSRLAPVGGDGIERGYLAFVAARLERGRSPFPSHVVLHGSRAEGTASHGSDFDLLVLFRDGRQCDFLVGQEAEGRRVEIEFAEDGKFAEVATRPVFHLPFGPVELSKIAKGVVLWGDAVAWEEWVGKLLGTALRLGRIPWMLYALGMSLQPHKLGAIRPLFVASMRAVMARADAEAYREEMALLESAHPAALGAHLRHSLDRELAGWREDMAIGRRVFAHQVPEVWMALRWIVERS